MGILDEAKKVEDKVEVKADDLIAKFQTEKHTGRIIAIIVAAILSLAVTAYFIG
jgi:hypothetical protein